MTSAMQVFSKTIDEQEVTMNALIVDDVPWFRGKDVANALGYTCPRNAIHNMVHEEDRQTLQNLMGTKSVPILGYRENGQVFISESGLYSLVLRSKMKDAEPFQRWVTKDVLPNIRKTGQYAAPTQSDVVASKRTELELLEIDERIKSCKWWCVEDGIMSLQTCGLQVDDRGRMRAQTA